MHRENSNNAREYDLRQLLRAVSIALAIVALLPSIVRAQLVSRTPSAALSTAGFISNRGQWGDGARYRAQSGSITAWLTDSGAVLDLSASPYVGHVVRQRFVGAVAAAIECGEQTSTSWTFLDGEMRHDARGFVDVTYRNIYPGIDARYYQSEGAIKYDVIVAPGADAEYVRMRYEGADAIDVDEDGALRIKTSVGFLREARPICYQVIGGAKRIVDSRFVVVGDVVRIDVAAYDRQHALIIDPALAFSSYIGGSGNDSGHGIAVDALSNIYVGGTTSSPDFPTTQGAYSRQPDRSSSLDLFVMKLDPSASVMLYGTYISGGGTDELAALRVHTDGTATIAGTTSSADFPTTPGAFQTTLRGISDGFILRLAANGRSLISSTYLGGTGIDRIEDLALNTLGQPFVVGSTTSVDLPTTAGSAFQTPRGGDDAFAARLAQPFDARNYITYLGGGGSDHAVALALGTGGAANITGWTTSDDFTTTAGAAQSNRAGGVDGFVMRLRFDGSVVEYGTYLGGTDQDLPTDIAIDRPGNQYVVGRTLSTDFPFTTGDPTGTWFATRVDSSTGAILTGNGYSRYIGRTHSGTATTVQATPGGIAYIAGSVERGLFPTTNDRLQAGPGGGLDIGFVELSSDGNTIVHASVIGGEGNDVPSNESQLSRFNDLYITGTTSSARFPTTRNAFDATLNTTGNTSRTDAFVLAFRFDQRPTILSPVRVEIDTVRCDTSARDTFFVMNGGDRELVISTSRFLRGDGRFILEDPSSPSSEIRIQPGDSARYIIRFRAPTHGVVSDTILIYNNDSLRNPLRIFVQGVRSSPLIIVQPASVNFDRLGACNGAFSERSVRVANAGNDVAI
ncbi:MAG: SBBP repeat-containing protein, partial [bacterium]|nr:SBBP repeat-containing protein [Candidatus Kapabacteria bacterium]